MSDTSGPCWLQQFSESPCDGPIDKCHLIPKQRIKRELRSRYPNIDDEGLRAAVWHDSMWVYGCRKHHGELDVSRTLRIPRDSLLVKTRVVAEMLGLGWSLDLDYPPS